MSTENDVVSLNTTPSSSDDSQPPIQVDPRNGSNQGDPPLDTISDDDPDENFRATSTIDSGTQSARSISGADVFHTMVARIAHSNATIKASTERQFGSLKDNMDENFDKMTVAMDVMRMATQQNGQEISEAISEMTEVNARTNVMTRTTSNQLEDLIKQMKILNTSMIDAISNNQSQQSAAVTNIVPSQTIGNSGSRHGQQATSGNQQAPSRNAATRNGNSQPSGSNATARSSATRNTSSSTSRSSNSNTPVNVTNQQANNLRVAPSNQSSQGPAQQQNQGARRGQGQQTSLQSNQAQQGFNVNEFSLALQDKIRYNDISQELNNIKLEGETMFYIEQFYSRIMMAITYAFKYPITTLPPFQALDPSIDFKTIFMDKIIPSSTVGFSVMNLYYRLGEMIKIRLTSKECINPDISPKAFEAVKINKIFNGWVILENLLKKRVVTCGAIPDYDLDQARSSLILMKDESYATFYLRCHELQSEYELSCKNIAHVPYIKILQSFLNQLLRVQEYVPFLIEYQRKLRSHLKTHGDMDYSIGIPFTIHEIFEDLQQNDVPLLPSTLSQQSQSESNGDKRTTRDEYKALIASSEIWLDADFDPTINSFRKIAKQRCKCCLVGIHHESQCWIRGPEFMPENLRKRIMLYNKQHGDKPPKGTKLREWNPKSIDADHQINNNGDKYDKENKNKNNKGKRYGNPFKNTQTKVKTTDKSELNQLDHDEDSDEDIIQELLGYGDFEQEEISADINGFVAEQCIIAKSSSIEDEAITPIYCSIDSDQMQKKLVFEPQEITASQPVPSNISDYTPDPIRKALTELHRSDTFRPNKKFIIQHAQALNRLPPSTFKRFCSLTFHVDNGANVNAVKDRRLFYFYISTETNAKAVDGSTFTAQGWGGILIAMHNEVYMLAPVFHCPANPRNTLSPQSLKHFSGFRKAIIDSGSKVIFVSHCGVKHDIQILSQNDLDFVDLEILMINDAARFQPSICSFTSSTEPDNDVYFPSINMVESNTTSMKTIFPANVMAIIAEYYIYLVPDHSPRDMAIRKWNLVFCSPYAELKRSQKNISAMKKKSLQRVPQIAAADSAIEENVYEPVINNLTRSSKQYYTPLQQYQRLHLCTLHTSKSVLETMIRKGTLKDLPTNIWPEVNKSNCNCYICMICKPKLLPRGKLVDKTNLKPFCRIHLDFHFFSVQSIRGFTSSLAAVCTSTSYPFNFPTKSKAPPIQIVLYLIRAIRSMGHEVHFIRVDEDGALAKSSEFCSLLIDENCIMETTGGGNSCNNGQVERANQYDANVIRPALSTMNILMGHLLPADMSIEMFWCCALQMSTMIHRRMYNRLRGDSPYFLVHNKRPSIKEFVPCGSLMTLINPAKSKLPKLSNERAKHVYFCAFGNNLRVHIYWDPDSPRQLKRSHHSIIEDTATFAILQEKVFVTTQKSDDQLPSTIPQEIKSKVITEDMISNCSNGFPGKEIKTVRFELPPYPQPLGIKICDDLLYNLPFLQSTIRNSFMCNKLPTSLRSNQFILSINADCPLTKTFAIDKLKEIQKQENRMCEIDFVHRGRADNTTSLSISRTMFDNFPSYLQKKPVIASVEIPATHQHFVTSPVQPDKPKSFFECLKSNFRSNWKAAAWKMFKKNKNKAVFSLPFPKEELPEGARVFRTLLVPEWKPTELKTVWEPRIRECVIGTPQKKLIDFDNSYAATVDPATVKSHLSYIAANDQIALIVDINNAFQNTFAKPENRIYVTVPPTYLEWLSHEENFEYDRSKTYYRMMYNSNQGTKDAANQWNALLHSIFEDFHLERSNVDHGLYVKPLKEMKSNMILSLATDDILIGVPHYRIAEDFVQYLNRFFDLTVQRGAILKFLGLRIIQTDKGISVDQGEYIFDLLQVYFGPDDEQVRTVSTPMRYDNQFEHELYEAMPLTDDELFKHALDYGGTYRYHTGSLGFAACLTRWDIKFPVQRLAEFNNAPNTVTFRAIDRIYRYLANDVIRPLMFPRTSFSGHTKLSYMITPGNDATFIIPNAPTNFNDAELGRCLSTRKSYFCTIIMVLGVIIQMKVKKTEGVMTHTTDSEMKASFEGCRHLIPIREIFMEMGCEIAEPSFLYSDNKAVVDVIDCGRMTPRCRHIAIPIAFLHHHKGKTFQQKLITTDKMIADIGTKPVSPALHKRFKYWGTGAQFLPEPSHKHYQYLQMEFYEMKFQDIVKKITK